MEPELINSKELAAMIGRSVKFVEKHRRNIAGSMKLGGRWSFRVSDIRSRIATGRDIVNRK